MENAEKKESCVTRRVEESIGVSGIFFLVSQGELTLRIRGQLFSACPLESLHSRLAAEVEAASPQSLDLVQRHRGAFTGG